MELIDIIIKLLSKYYLCDRCLGRLFAQLGRGFSNADRGHALKMATLMEVHRRIAEGENVANYLTILHNLLPYSQHIIRVLGINIHATDRRCAICENTIDELITEYAQRVADLVTREGISSFLIGVKPPTKMVENEKRIVSEFSLKFWESIRSELKREIGKRVKELTGVEPNFVDPDVIFVLDVENASIHMEIPSILILGTYWKLGRRISQVPWISRSGKDRKSVV